MTEMVEVGESHNLNGVYLFSRDVLECLFSYATFSELKRFRLVCRDWNVYVCSYYRLLNCRAVFREDWLMKARGLNIESALKWKSVYFHFFPWKNNTIFPDYWAHAGQNVTILNFKNYTLPCSEMVKFLNSIPLLTELTFNQCTFEMTKLPVYRNTSTTTIGNGSNNNDNNREISHYLKSCCPHDLQLTPESESPPVPPPLIRVLKLIKADCFPLCILRLLVKRTEGTLQVFHYDHARWYKKNRDYCYPDWGKVLSSITAIMRGSVNTLRDFSFVRNSYGELILHAVIRFINIAPVIVNIDQQTLLTEFSIQYINNLDANKLQRLTITFNQLSFNGPNFQTILARKVNLKYLMVDVMSRQGLPLNLAALFPVLNRLEGIHIRDRNRKLQPCVLDAYLTTPLPVNVKSMAFYGYYLPEEKIKTFVQSESALRLHSLMIEGGRYITDDTFQLIIKTLPQLEVLAVNDSRYLTDAGVTGIPLDTIKEILKCQQRIIFSGEFELDDNLPGVPVSQMQNLRKLSLAGCRKLSDITIFMGIKFPYLREVDLSRCFNITDIGIILLPKHNPCLERIIIMKNPKITHFGLNQVLIQNECIENIHTSKKIRDRKIGKLSYEVCDRFKTAVTYCHCGEFRARPMFSD